MLQDFKQIKWGVGLTALLHQAVPSGHREGEERVGYRSKVAGQGLRFPLRLEKEDRH